LGSASDISISIVLVYHLVRWFFATTCTMADTSPTHFHYKMRRRTGLADIDVLLVEVLRCVSHLIFLSQALPNIRFGTVTLLTGILTAGWETATLILYVKFNPYPSPSSRPI
jgi:hypothetical protein